MTKINFLKHLYRSEGYSDLYLYIVIVGTGGNGSEFIRQLSQVIAATDVPHTIVLADSDIVEEKNLRNQIFLSSEIGEKKADVLAERYGEAYPNLNIYSYSDKYIENIEDLTHLLNPLYIDKDNFDGHHHRFLPTLVSCVDNNFSRKLIHDAYNALTNCLYIDAGNESVVMPKSYNGLLTPFNEWTSTDQQNYRASGWSGQVVCGVKLDGEELQPPLAGLYPSIMTDTDLIKAPSEVSCADLAASDPQRTLVNKFSALSLMTYFYEIIEEKSLSIHHTQFHAKKGYMKTDEFDLVKFNEIKGLLK